MPKIWIIPCISDIGHLLVDRGVPISSVISIPTYGIFYDVHLLEPVEDQDRLCTILTNLSEGTGDGAWMSEDDPVVMGIGKNAASELRQEVYGKFHKFDPQYRFDELIYILQNDVSSFQEPLTILENEDMGSIEIDTRLMLREIDGHAEYLATQSLNRCDSAPSRWAPGNMATVITGGCSIIKVDEGIELYHYRSSFNSEENGHGSVIFLHGGGYCCGGPLHMHSFVTNIVQETNQDAFVVRYLLAPDHALPEILQSIQDAIGYVRDNARKLGIDSSKIQLFGCSSGANAALLVTISEGLMMTYSNPSFLGLVLVVPVINNNASNKDELRASCASPGLTESRLLDFQAKYLPDPSVVPEWQRNPNNIDGDVLKMTKLPPMRFILAENDRLRPEAEKFASILADCGHEITVQTVEKAFHASLELARKTSSGRKMFELAREAIIAHTTLGRQIP